MHAASLPEYAPPLRFHSPAYTATPQTHEHQLALNPRLRPNRLPCSFVKQTKSGNVSLKLVDQDAGAALPVYGLAATVQGAVEINKTEGITSVEVQIEGILRLEEVAEGGASTRKLFSKKSMLWVKNRVQHTPCPNSLRFSFSLPTTYVDGEHSYSLPPSFESHLSGLPGFRANVSYGVSAFVVKPNGVSNIVKSTLFRKDDWTVFTPFLYYPRTRPAVPIPPPLVVATSAGFVETPEWKLFSSTCAGNRRGLQGLMTKLYIPSTRIFCVRQPIPFHLSFHSDASSLLAFLPLAPVAGLIAPKRQATRIHLMRQTSVDVRNALILGTKTNIWRVDCIGEGAFRDAGIGPDWAAFSGDIFISDEVTIGGFRSSGFTVRDYLVLTTTPPDLEKSPFKELRMVVPIRLATDRWTSDGTGVGVSYIPSSISSSEELSLAPDFSCTPSSTTCTP